MLTSCSAGKFRKVRWINKTFFGKSQESIIFAPDLVSILVFLYNMLGIPAVGNSR